LPSNSSARPRAVLAIGLATLAAVAVVVVYRVTLHYGFDYDDYHFVRPYPLSEVRAVFLGPWDATGVEVPFYRPLAIAFFALRFELFGLNATAYHMLSLALFALSAALAAWLILRLTSRASAAIIALLLFVSHPAMPYSLVAWITNQMHLLQTVVVLAALIWWHVVRRRSLAWWVPLLVFGAAAFLIKEDGVMLLPAIIVVHVLTRWIAERDLQPLPWRFVLLCALTLGVLVLVRFYALGGLGGYGRPNVQQAWINMSAGLNGVFRLVPAHRQWQGVASGFATALPLVALLAWPWISRPARLCLAAGVAIAFLFNLPFVFVSKAEQAYLLGTGAVITLTGASIALLDLSHRAARPIPLAAASLMVLAAGMASFATVARDIARDFDPYGPYVLSHDEIVRTWWPVPPELRDYLARKRASLAARRLSTNPLDELRHASFGFMGPETNPQGQSYLWMAGPRTEIQVSAGSSVVTIPIRHQIEAFREPTRASIVVDGRLANELIMDDSRWQTVQIPLRPNAATRVGRMHRIKIVIDHAWRPSDVIPGSSDRRILGLQIGELVVR
jgi:hypothetical protein